MPVTGVVLEEVMPAAPVCGAFVGTRLVTMSATVSGSGAVLQEGTFTIYDTATGLDRSFSGLSASNRNPNCAVALGGFAYTITSGSSSAIQRIDPVTGLVTSLASRSFFNRWMDVVGSTIWVAANSTVPVSQYSPSTNTWLTGTENINATASGVINNRLFYGRTGGLREIDQSTANQLNSYDFPAGSTPVGRGAVVGDSIYWGTSTVGIILGFNATTSTPFELVLSPAGAPTMNHEFINHQGVLVGFAPSNSIRLVNPSTGQWESTTTPTNTSLRYFIISDGTHVYLPSGHPVS